MQGTGKQRSSQTWQIKVKGAKWRYRILTPDRYRKTDPSDNSAITDSKRNIMYFRTDDIAWDHCVHELFHAFVSELHLTSAGELTRDDFEEIIAEMLEKYILEITEKATMMFKRITESEVMRGGN